MPDPVPVLLVTGFLGAGKTTVVNDLLARADGRRIAAVVNDFGAVNIDAELIAGAVDGVVSLPGGCICCALEGDLLRTLAMLLRRAERPEAIVIECSGVAEPAGVVRTLMDPVVWREAPLETVLCVLDAGAWAVEAADGPWEDALQAAQLRAADVVALNKADLAGPEGCARAQARVAAVNPRAAVVACEQGRVSPALLFPQLPAGAPSGGGTREEPRAPRPRDPGRAGPHAERFEAVSWTDERPLALGRLQAAIGRLAPRLARAKGVFEVAGEPGRRLVLQLAGGRATLAAAPAGGASGARLVFVAEVGALSEAEVARAMEACVAG